MDPQAAWDQMLRAFACEEWSDVHEYATALSAWLDRRGFPPKVIINPSVGDPFNSALALSACEFALARAAENGWPP